MKIKERGYYELKWGDQSKWMHLASRLFMSQIKEVSGLDMIEFGTALAETEGKTEQEVLNMVSELAHAGFRAYDLEEDNEIDYNGYKVGNWLWEAMNESDKVLTDMFETMQAALPLTKGVKGKKKR